MKPGWVPDAGETVWLHFDPQAGHEQSGRRPAVALSPASYNGLTGLMLCVPLTTHVKGYRFEVAIAGGPASVALADHLKSFDWRTRGAKPKGWVSAAELEAIRARARALVG